MSKLPSMQRAIQRSYLDNEEEFDYIISGEMGVSNSTFRRLKGEVIGILANLLKLIVFSKYRMRSADVDLFMVLFDFLVYI
ncbi:hypothetical protein ACWGXJ_14015 [Paenibacillus sp. S33]